MPLEWRRIPEDEDLDVIIWCADSPELQYQHLFSLLPYERDIDGLGELGIDQFLGREYPTDTELWVYDVHFYNLDGERVEGFPMMYLYNIGDMDECHEICDMMHTECIAWADAHPEWRKEWLIPDEGQKISRLVRPMYNQIMRLGRILGINPTHHNGNG